MIPGGERIILMDGIMCNRTDARALSMQEPRAPRADDRHTRARDDGDDDESIRACV